MDAGRTVSFFMTGSPMYYGESIEHKRTSHVQAQQPMTKDFSFQAAGPNASYTSSRLMQTPTPKSDTFSFFSCCSSDADQQKQFETSIMSGVDLKPIKRTDHVNKEANTESYQSPQKTSQVQTYSTPQSQNKEFQDDHKQWYTKSNSRVNRLSFGSQSQLSDSFSVQATKSVTMDPKQLQKYKKIMMKYDMERDQRLSQVEQVYQESLRLSREDRIDQQKYQEMKLRIQWDIAWQIFAEVNEKNDTDKVIDLNCLDVSEAKGIARQCILDLAKQLVQKQKTSSKPIPYHLLTINCAADHTVQMINSGQLTQSKNQILKMIDEAFGLEYFYVEEKEIVLVKITGTVLNGHR